MGLYDWLNKKENNVVEKTSIKVESDFSNFKLVTDYIYEKSGITDLDKRTLTSSNLKQYTLSKDIYTTDELLNKMKSDDEIYQEIINIATINETFFFREIKELEWLIDYIKNSNKPLKILSIPCSSGEEIYSILLLMSKENIDLNKVEITGYDINSYAVSQAKSGKYNEHSLHKVDTKTREKYFSINSDNTYEISQQLKNIPTFSQENIFDLELVKNKFDIVLSRNMFIYFDDKKRKLATNIIENILKSNGIYIKGHADHIYKHPNLENIHFGIYKKYN